METIASATTTLDDLLAAYSTGRLGRRELEQTTGLWFGEILTEMACRHLPLPRVDTSVEFNPAQQRLFNQVFG